MSCTRRITLMSVVFSHSLPYMRGHSASALAPSRGKLCVRFSPLDRMRSFYTQGLLTAQMQCRSHHGTTIWSDRDSQSRLLRPCRSVPHIEYGIYEKACVISSPASERCSSARSSESFRTELGTRALRCGRYVTVKSRETGSKGYRDVCASPHTMKASVNSVPG
ncbi:hypothetical protein HDF14_005372 [Edaphobacter lichenicola]|jgi:hypothetical protein|uniref:Uncharacterized protein n=1 Tax=Tunturiibacter gelidiferens TaxID=3069689 RepID=A0A9X0QK32_9BACT|nr:hypothetical protein [Edaphobacter lichenicola]